MTDKKDKDQSIAYSTAVRFVKGGSSGFVSGALLQPLQVIKTSMQISPINKDKSAKKIKSNLSFMEATSTIHRTEGMKGFLRGLWPSLLKSTLTSGTFFSMLFYFEENLKKMNIMSPS